MSAFRIELTEKQWEIVEEIWAKVEQETAYLTTLSQEQRLAWTVNAHFSKEAETADGKVNRILSQNIAL